MGNPEGMIPVGRMGLGNFAPRPGPPGGCPGGGEGGAGAEPAALPLSGGARLPRLPQRVRVGGNEEKQSRGVWEGNSPGGDTPFGG